MRTVQVVQTPAGIETLGLSAVRHPEIRAWCQPRNATSAASYFSELAERIAAGRRLKDGELVGCGSWLLRFDYIDGYFVAKEASPEKESYLARIDRAIECWRSQGEMCSRHNADFDPIGFEDRIVATPDVVDQPTVPVEGMRIVPADPKFADLLILGPMFTGNYAEQVKTFHAYHIMDVRPELIQYLALPRGFRFCSDGTVYFDAELTRPYN